jgi:hypothetical protein
MHCGAKRNEIFTNLLVLGCTRERHNGNETFRTCFETPWKFAWAKVITSINEVAIGDIRLPAS